MDLRGHWSSVCPALLRYPRRNQVAPDFCVAGELSHRWGGAAALQRPHFGAPSPASIITSSFSPALFLRRNAAASLYSCELKQATPCSKRSEERRVGKECRTTRGTAMGVRRRDVRLEV